MYVHVKIRLFRVCLSCIFIKSRFKILIKNQIYKSLKIVLPYFHLICKQILCISVLVSYLNPDISVLCSLSL